MDKQPITKVLDPNLRRMRAEALTAALMDELRPVLYEIDRFPPHNWSREIFRAILDTLVRNGAHVLTDRDRKEMGLEARDHHGWTVSERVAQENKRLENMLVMQRIIIPNNDLTEGE